MKAREKFRMQIQTQTTHHWPAAPGRKNNRPAAIMIPIIDDGTWTVVMTKRKKELKTHAGEMCFPGGKPDPKDHDLSDTALRETKEEIGFTGGVVLGRLSSIPLYTSDFRLEPFVGMYPPQPLKVSNAEVEQCLLFSLNDVLSLGEVQGVGMEWPEYGEFISPVFCPEHFTHNHTGTTTPIFGGTAHVLWELLTVFSRVVQKPLPQLNPSLTSIPKNIK